MAPATAGGCDETPRRTQLFVRHGSASRPPVNANADSA